MSQEIIVKRSSHKTGECSDLILRDKNRSKLVFKPKIVDNDKEKLQSVSGKFLYIKDDFNPENEIKLSPQKVQSSNYMELSLHTDEVHKLYQHLSLLYQIDPTSYGSTMKLIGVDTEYNVILNYFDKMPEVLEQVIIEEDSLQLIRNSQQILTAIACNEGILSNLLDVEDALDGISNLAQIKTIKRLCEKIENNLSNDSEQYWQEEILEKNSWVLSQIFAEPMIIFQGTKAYLGGKDIKNQGGKIVDFAYKNALTNHVTFIEIKTPKTPLLGSSYRSGIYPISADVNGSLAQVMSYKKIFLDEYIHLKHRSPEEDFDAVNPKTVVVIGTISSLNIKERQAFELYRRELRDTIIITFDELLEKVKSFIVALSDNASSD